VAVTRDSLVILPNRGGRPKVAEPGVSISTRISPRHYDVIASAAAREGVTVAAFVRGILRRAVTPPRPGRKRAMDRAAGLAADAPVVTTIAGSIININHVLISGPSME
jgi:hypothetical protein